MLFSSATTHPSPLSNPLSPFPRGKCILSTSFLGCNAPWIVMAFLIFVSMRPNSSLVHLMIHPLYLGGEITHVFAARTFILSFSPHFIISFNLLKFSLLNRSFISLFMVPYRSRIPKCLYQIFSTCLLPPFGS